MLYPNFFDAVFLSFNWLSCESKSIFSNVSPPLEGLKQGGLNVIFSSMLTEGILILVHIHYTKRIFKLKEPVDSKTF